MGEYTIIPFIQYFFKDILKAKNPALYSSIWLVILIFMCIPASLLAGHYSDKYQARKSMVYLSTAVMGTGCVALGIVTYFPSITAAFIIAAVLGLGFGTYIAVDWALALDCLPEGSDIGKDMGIWHLSIVLPQVIAPVIAGAVLNGVKQTKTFQDAYCALFGITLMWFILAIIFIYPVKIVKKAVK